MLVAEEPYDDLDSETTSTWPAAALRTSGIRQTSGKRRCNPAPALRLYLRGSPLILR